MNIEELLNEKLKLAVELKDFTSKILALSPKTDYAKVNFMIGQRQNYMDRIDEINAKIKELDNKNLKFLNSNDAKAIKEETRLVFKEIDDMDKSIRKNINSELKNIKNILNQPKTSPKSLNIKA